MTTISEELRLLISFVYMQIESVYKKSSETERNMMYNVGDKGTYWYPNGVQKAEITAIEEETFGTVVYLETENGNKESFIVYGDDELRWAFLP